MAADGTTFPPFRTIPELKPATGLNFTDQVWINQGGALDVRTNIGDIVAAFAPAGTVASVSSTTPDLTVANPTTAPALTVNAAPKWTTPRNLSFQGDVVGSGLVDGSLDVATGLTLAAVNANPGVYGDATDIPQITVDAKGRVTQVVPVPIVIASAPRWTTPRTLSFSGDATGSSLVDGSASVVTPLTLAAANGAPGVYGAANVIPQITVDAKGRVTNVTNIPAPSGLGGTVTSVGFTAPAGFTVGGSPITTSGVLALGIAAQAASAALIAPAAGGVPTFRALAAADIPSLSALYLPLTGGTVTGPVTINATGLQALAVDGAAGNVRPINFTTAGVQRWRIGANSTAEGGSNTGSDFIINPFVDGGGLVVPGAGLTITRATGLVTVADLAINASKAANQVLAAPAGAAGAPGFRLLVGADLPNPAAASKGGVQSAAAVAHQWINSISTAGVPALSQPAMADISDYLGATTISVNVIPSTLGDFNVAAYAANSLQYVKIGPVYIFFVNIVINGGQVTWTTAAGSLSIGPIPFFGVRPFRWPVVYAGAAAVTGGVLAYPGGGNANFMNQVGSVALQLSNFTSGGGMSFIFSGMFF